MKKTSYHVNPAVNKWEEEQRRLRMEKMIQRAKSTLPPEARGASKPSGPKKPTPYTAENIKPIRKRSTGGQGTPAGPAGIDVQELDSLIYNRVQEILGMPLMRRAGLAQAALKGATPPQRSPSSAPGGRRPAWNNDWNAPGVTVGGGTQERQIGGGIGSRSSASHNTNCDRSPTTKLPAGNGRPAPAPAGHHTGTPSKGSRIPGPAAQIDIPLTGSSLGVQSQRRPSTISQVAAEERVVLLQSPPAAAAGAASRGPMTRPASSRYGSAAGALPGGDVTLAAERHMHLPLEHSMVATIEALNPQAPAAREAAIRLAQHQQTQREKRLGPAPAASPTAVTKENGVTTKAVAPGGSAAAAYNNDGPMLMAHLSGSVSGGGAAAISSRDASLMQSVGATGGPSQGGSSGTASVRSSSRRPPIAPPVPLGAWSRGAPQAAAAAAAAAHLSRASKERVDAAEEEEDTYADDDFEEYDGTEDDDRQQHEHAGLAAAAQDMEEEGCADGDGSLVAMGDAAPDIAMLRDSVSALNGLLQLKIQQELARSQQQQHAVDSEQQQQLGSHHRQSLQTGGHIGQGVRQQVSPPEMLASLALVGSREADDARVGLGHGGRVRDRTISSLGDGLRQSDLDYLARLGGGEPNEGLDVANSTDDTRFLIEPGAPAGTAKAWGDRQPWTTDKCAEAGATGFQKLRARQERERQQQQQQQDHQEQEALAAGRPRLSQQGLQDKSRLAQGGPEQPAKPPPSARGEGSGPGDEDDSVLLGEIATPRHRTGAAAQMQAVSNALAALASSGHLSSEDAQELRSQTDALFGSLVQLHDLMNGPRGPELCTSSPSSGGAVGFTPSVMSPEDSPSQSFGRHPAVAPAAAYTRVQARTREPVLQQVESAADSEYEARIKAADGAQPARVAGSHFQLTPKHKLIAEDVAWMAGLAQSLSKSLQVDHGDVELPGI